VIRTGVRATSPFVSVFVQYGRAGPLVSEIARHGSFGLVSTVPALRRRGDHFGAMVSFVDISDAARAGFDTNETVVELFYRFRVTEYLSIQPDVQYVSHPSGSTDVVHGAVASVRLELAL
jgi:carbohydrate-selective porin OprB